MPLVVVVLLTAYVPIGGWIISLFNYKPGIPLFQNEYIGFKFFKEIFSDVDIWRTLTNTLIFSGIQFLLMPLPMLFAIALNEITKSRYRRIVQTMTTLPHFVSWVIVYSMAFVLFSNGGLMNTVLTDMGIISEPLKILDNNNIVYTLQNIIAQWKDLGWGAIIYIAAIAGIDQEQYEAATIDGAGRFRTVLAITIPNLMPTFVVLMLLNVAGFINTGYEQYFVFKNSMVMGKIEVLDLYIYRMGLQLGDYSYSTAVGIIKSFVSIAMLFTVNKISKHVRGESII